MMFDVSEDKKIYSDIPVIAGNYVELYYDEVPILFTGNNRYGYRIVGSIMCEDEELDIYRYLYVFVNSEEYNELINGEIPYRDLILSRQNIFLIDKNFNEETLKIYCVPPSSIPDNFLPRHNFKLNSIPTPARSVTTDALSLYWLIFNNA